MLIDPIKSTKGNFVPAWSSSLDTAVFVAQLTMTMGLIGRDVMQEWKSVALIPTPHNATSRWQITIRA